MKIFPPEHKSIDKGHGRIEIRKIQTSTALNGYITFPYAAQVFKIERQVYNLLGDLKRQELVYGITSLSENKADTERLLTLNRGHWTIENTVHWVRDVTFDEDRSQVRAKEGPRVMATLRNLAISLLRLNGADNIAKALRENNRKPERVLKLLAL